MANTASNVTQAKPATNGAVYVAPLGTALPTDATSDLDKAYVSLGYLTEDGITGSESIDTSETKAWGGDTVLTSQTGKTDTYQFALMEALNPDVLKFVYGDDNVTGTLETGITIKSNSSSPVAHAMVIDMLLSAKVLKRITVPSATITTRDDISYKADEPITYGVTVSATPDESGNTHYEYITSKS
jgi:hypothetical protein